MQKGAEEKGQVVMGMVEKKATERSMAKDREYLTVC